MLHLKIRFSHSSFIPICIEETAPVNDVLSLIRETTFFFETPKMIYDGHLLEPFLSLKAQGIIDNTEIVVYEPNSLRIYGNGKEAFSGPEYDFLNIPLLPITPFECKLFSIMNEMNRIEDFFILKNECSINSHSRTLDESFDRELLKNMKRAIHPKRDHQNDGHNGVFNQLTILSNSPSEIPSAPLPTIQPLA